MPSYVIIGASRGIGYQFLKTLSRDPSNIIIGTARNVGPIQAKVTADKLTNVHIIEADLDSPSSLHAAAGQTSKITGGAADYLIVNGAYLNDHLAAFKPYDFLGKEEYFMEQLDRSMHTNVAGVLFAINAFLPLVKKSIVKKVIVISSAMGDIDTILEAGVDVSVPYSMSKAAVNILVAKYAVSFKNEGISFLSLCPGMVLTQVESYEAMTPELIAQYDFLKQLFRNIAPDFKGPMLPEESVEKQLKVINNLSIENTGAYLSHKGTKEWV
ncbi:NAD(P)-binding protein [Lojkania enalia]|uniref:NAD(P)-binding protein n=1 Tax=Lojkania enalia TaxID=147567 RepID=A0A9P4N282_9PLEO|nr:NAD(P)-binding protein [Didymosphaeria enalia]